ncbi:MULTISPECIES: efflux RND transporter periplasmic adaptor subunit [Fusobacterium]|uniref:efflux RND transporter periplasmic adaptor subunit n=1 Tax=Fusobacterium TaxID=848 RepID=UPI0014770B04|nr:MULTISPECIES: efflux RND transporter periplasmic adaptor subunit [Fusobacterium]NME36756.1 efflux RND transporter periplasmic adaptor subunit [Fusobacterium sp. FSA-380-WT-3A]
MKKIILFVSMTLLLISCKDDKPLPKKEVTKEVKSIELKEITMDNIEIYNGEINPNNDVKIITPTGGYVKEIYFKNGDNITKDEVILKLEDIETETNYLQGEGNLYKAKSDYETQKISFEKYEKLYKKDFISEDTYLTAKNNLSQSYGVYKTAEGNFLDVKDKKERLLVKAPIDGVIIDLDLKLEEKITPNSEILSVIDNSIMEIKVAISGKSVNNIKVGDEAQIYIEELNKEVVGKIESINLSANQDTKKYQVKITFNNEEKDILKGMYGKVKINQGKTTGLFIPKEAIMVKDLYTYIAIMRDGKALIYKVDSKESIGNYQEIIFKDYQEGDRVVIEGQYLLNNNDKIKERAE